MIEDMMKQCCSPEGIPDFEKMKKFMEKYGKMQFADEEIRNMKECCAQIGMPNVEKLKELMKKCGCHVPEATS